MGTLYSCSKSILVVEVISGGKPVTLVSPDLKNTQATQSLNPKSGIDTNRSINNIIDFITLNSVIDFVAMISDTSLSLWFRRNFEFTYIPS